MPRNATSGDLPQGDELPPPLVPADVDLRDFGYMPLHVGMLLSSALWVKAKRDPRIGHAAMSLWCKAWHEVPAASLPYDDELLADYAGCDPDEWARVRDRVLVNFVRCSDGRLYHETVAKQAIEAWEIRLGHRSRTAAATAAREARKQAAKERDEQRDDARDEQRDVQRDVQRGANVTFTKGREGKGREGKRREEKEIQPTPNGVGSGAAQSATPPTPPPDFDGNNGEALNGKAVVAIAPGWELPTTWGFDAEALGWKPGEVLREAEKFRQYWTQGKGKGKRRSVKGWRQSWSNWLEKAAGDTR